ncbi:MAG: DNA topoisomerase IV subunit A [Betaproteobacteria bacterium]
MKITDNNTPDLFADIPATDAAARPPIAPDDAPVIATPANPPEPAMAPDASEPANDAAPSEPTLHAAPTEPPSPPPPADAGSSDDDDGDGVPLHLHAERDYLEYAMSVVLDRALPDVRDGQKPVQRRVLYAMRELGLSATAKPVKSARVVGDVIGKYHPHGDQSVYDAMVRVAQDFSLRYPLVDGQGNFGSRDGDNAAAMRYTEARLTPISELLLSEIDENTVDFIANYDGSFEEPASLPARLPLVLANGASGIAVGMATEIPPHNLRELAAAAVHVLARLDEEISVADLAPLLPGPDYPGGGQIITPAADIAAIYASGRGSLRVRCRYQFEEMARGAWQLVVNELPPGVSVAKVLSEIGAILNPQPKAGKKAPEQSALQLKGLFASQLERARDESDKSASVRLVFEPASIRLDRQEFLALLLAHTSLECSAPINLVAIGLDRRPRQKSVVEILREWCISRIETVERRTRHRLSKAEDRIHILEGRHIVFLNIDEVIRIIRESDEPKPALMQRFILSERQADDILEIRLRQLARLEGIKIEQELAKLRDERAEYLKLLESPTLLRKLVVREIKADAAKYGDDRRTLIETAEGVMRSAVATVADEPVTVIVSKKGWARARQGHGIDLSGVAFKDGDTLMAAFECRSVDSLAVLSADGRSFTISVASLPDGRGMGAPIASFADFGARKIAQVLVAKPQAEILIAKTSGYGFVCKFEDLLSRQKAGKAFLTVEDGAAILPPEVIGAQTHLGALSSADNLLIFPLPELKRLSGGKGVQIMALKGNETLVQAIALPGPTCRITGISRGKSKELLSSDAHLGQRAKRGRVAAALQNIRIDDGLDTA